MTARKTKKKAKKRVRKKAKKKTGRPLLCTAARIKEAGDYAGLGASNALIAELLGVTEKTFYNWMANEKFAQSVEAGRAKFETGDIERSLRAQALPHDEVTEFYEARRQRSKKGQKARLTERRVSRTVKKNRVNTRAGEIILKAEKPEKYGDKLNLGTEGGIPLKVIMFGEPKKDGADTD